MEKEVVKVVMEETNLSLKGFSPVNSTRIFWRSRMRSGATAIGRNSNGIITEEEEAADKKTPTKAEAEDSPMEEKTTPPEAEDAIATPVVSCVLSEKRKALFEPLEPINGGRRGAAFSNESLIPPPDFDSTSYPKGWLVGKKRKLVNVDVVESMRRIAVQELNRKDREIDGLNEQLEEDARCLEHIQLQLLQEKSKRAEVERENNMLQDQISMLMNMLDDENNPDPAAASAGEEDDQEEP